MATKMCFFTGKDKAFEERIVEFEYVMGTGIAQKRKNVLSFHKSIREKYPDCKILEISTKSQTELGVSLSAFNLRLDGYILECVYHSSKVFEGDVQYPELLTAKPKDAKKLAKEVDLPLKCFRYKGEEFDLEPKPMFYDYIYISALLESDIDTSELLNYDIFTDIEFNEKKRVNCQARSCAIYAYMLRTNTVEYYMSSVENFKKLYSIGKN